MQNFVGKTKCIAGYMKVANGHYLGAALGLGQFENKKKRKRNARLKVNPKENTKSVSHCASGS